MEREHIPPRRPEHGRARENQPVAEAQDHASHFPQRSALVLLVFAPVCIGQIASTRRDDTSTNDEDDMKELELEALDKGAVGVEEARGSGKYDELRYCRHEA